MCGDTGQATAGSIPFSFPCRMHRDDSVAVPDLIYPVVGA